MKNTNNTNNDFDTMDNNLIIATMKFDEKVDKLVKKNNKKKKKSRYNDNNVVVIRDTTTIPEYTNHFNKKKRIRVIKITEGVTGIPDYAFKDWVTVKEIIFPRSLKFIGNHAFEGCVNLRKITKFSETQVTKIPEECFANTLIQKAILPVSVTTIGKGAFKNCRALSKVGIPEGVTKIPSDCFKGCYTLECIKLPSTIKELGGNAFQDCVSLRDITSIEADCDNLKQIGSYCFKNCKSITDFYVPDTVTNIGNEAFADCIMLWLVTLSKNMQTISASTFKGCTRLNIIYMHGNIKRIGKDAFLNCTNLEGVAFDIENNQLQYIGQNAFKNCTSLSRFGFTSKVKVIERGAFSNCTGLTQLYMKESSITTINSRAFYGCSSLRELIIPNTVQHIDVYAFQDCVNLETIEFAHGSRIKFIADHAFDGCDKAKLLNLPETACTSWKKECMEMSDEDICNGCVKDNCSRTRLAGIMKIYIRNSDKSNDPPILHLDTAVVDGEYDDTTKNITLTLEDGETVEISLMDLIKFYGTDSVDDTDT
jgi:hypothetical protein